MIMKSVGQVIKQNQIPLNSQLTKVQNKDISITASNNKWLCKWKDPSEVENQFAPIHWGYALRNPDKAYLADCPTLLNYDKAYGEGVSARWIYIQVLALYGTSSCKDEGISRGIWLFAESFASEVKGFKISELLLFFARYQAGKYDSSFTSFDTKRIGNCFFSQFVKERNFELERIQRQEIQRENEERRFIPPKGYTSWSWYQELKKRAEFGDNQAKKTLGIM